MWTSWHNRDTPSFSGDIETRRNYWPPGTCAERSEPPSAVQARISGSKEPWSKSSDVITVNPDHGLSCQNNQQVDNSCEDYEVRYCCALTGKTDC